MNAAPIIASITASDIPMGIRSARHLDHCWRDMMRGRDGVEGDGFFRVMTGENHPLGNVAIISDASNLEVARAAVGPLIDLSLPAMVLYTEGITEGVAQSLVGRGFVPGGAMPAMAIDIERLPARALPPGFNWVRVDAHGSGSAWSDVLAKCFDMPPTLARRFSPESLGADMAVDAPVQFFGITRGGEMAATSMLFLADGLAGIYSVATLPPMRGQGLGAYATAEALRTAHRLGYRVGVLQSSESGHSVYLGLGFQDLGSVSMFIRMPA